MRHDDDEVVVELPPLDVHRRYPIRAACEYLSLSRATLYERINNGLIASITDGRRRYIPGSEIARLSMVSVERAA